MIAKTHIARHRGERCHDNSASEVHILPDVCQRVNQVDKTATFLDYCRVIFDFVLRITYGADEDIVFSNDVTVDIPKNLGFVVVPSERIGPTVEKSLNPPGGSRGNRLRGPRENFTTEVAGADDYKILGGKRRCGSK